MGPAPRGPVDEPVALTSLAEFCRVYGEPQAGLGHAVQDFYRQGGFVAIVVRAHAGTEGDTALLTFEGGLVLRAASPGAWGSALVARTDGAGRLVVSDTATGLTESFADPSQAGAGSALVRVESASEEVAPGQVATLVPATETGDPVDATAYTRALQALRRADLVNLLVVPGDLAPEVVAEAVTFAEERRAIFVMDAPSAWSTADAAIAGATSAAVPRSANAAVYFPRIRLPGPRRGPGGAVAGVIARNDLTRGVWKAPAGVEADLEGVTEVDLALDDRAGSRLNQLGVNCLRTFPGTGPVVWGARTTDPEWTYVPVRRLALFLEASIERGVGWAVFEPNGEALWARIRQEVGDFLHDLFRRGAFCGGTPRDAFFVRCDADTTTADDAARGVVNIVVGFASLRPAEFVVLRLQAVAGRVP